MDDELIDRLVDVFKAVAEPTRLRILGALAERPLTGTDLVDRFKISAPSISHHMAKLVGAGLVQSTRDGQRRVYTLQETALRELLRGVAQRDGAAGATGHLLQDGGSWDMAPDPERAKILRDFFDGPRLKQIPAQRKKRVVVLQHLLLRFTPGRSYPEREVNDLLRTAHEDVATLRRELVDYGFLTRDKGVYEVAGTLPQRSTQVAQEITGDEQAWLRALLQAASPNAAADR